MDQSVIFMLAAVLLVGVALFAMMTFGKKGKQHLNVDYYRSKWLSIEKQLKSDEPSSFHLVVLNADKLLDQAFRERGFKGQNMGERLRSAGDILSNRNAVWTSHKLRNQIAHESEVRVSLENARTALDSFKQALKDVGAI